MDAQTIIALLVVLAAVLYMGRRAWRTLRPAGVKDGDAGCGGSSCGCH